jgi:hypothetical protein
MASVKNRVQETTTTTGTGTITLAGAVSGYQSFATAFPSATTLVYYCIVSGSLWEVGIGLYTLSGTTLARSTVQDGSSGAGTAITLSGTSNVFVSYAADIKTTASELTVVTKDGDLDRLSQDTSYFRQGSNSILTSGTMYTLIGELAMFYWTHNTALDVNGNFTACDDNGTCEFWVFTESGLIRQYWCPTTTAGQVPGSFAPWVQTMYMNVHTGQQLLRVVDTVGIAVSYGNVFQ